MTPPENNQYYCDNNPSEDTIVHEDWVCDKVSPFLIHISTIFSVMEKILPSANPASDARQASLNTQK